MIETSGTTAKLDAALAKAQGEIEAASKDKVNPAFRSKYADLTSVWAAIRPALSKHGIAVTQWPIHSEDGRLHIVTRLAHDGEWIMAHFSIPVQKQDPHGYGSATTYAKRFSLAAAVGVVADEDDDGNAASGKTEPQPEPKYARSKIVRAEFDRVQKGIHQICQTGSEEDLKMFWKTNAETIAALPADWREEMEAIKENAKEHLRAKVAA